MSPVVWQSAISSFTNSISRSSNPCVLFMCNTSLSVGIIAIYTVRYSDSSKAVCLTRRCNTMLQSEITGDGMDAVASEISLVE